MEPKEPERQIVYIESKPLDRGIEADLLAMVGFTPKLAEYMRRLNHAITSLSSGPYRDSHITGFTFTLT